MYLSWFLCALMFKVAEQCTLLSGGTGKCVPIRLCPTLLMSFTSPSKVATPILYKLLCSNGELGLNVCCGDVIVDGSRLNFNPYNLTSLNADVCGITDNSVIHNRNIRLQDFPWLVKLTTIDSFYKTDKFEKVGCTGVLISRWHVLYSTQCHYAALRSDRIFFIRIEQYSNNGVGCDKMSYSPECSDYENYAASEFFVHPFYDDVTKFNDIAILTLVRPIRFTDHLRPICLPNSTQTVKVGDTLQTAGWNRTYYPNQLSIKIVQSSIVTANSDCKELLNDGTDQAISEYEICTDTKENIIDQDNIGLPLMSLHNNKWYIQGFESQGQSVKSYSRVEKYLLFIGLLMDSVKCTTPFKETGELTPLSDCPRILDVMANVSPNDEKAIRKFVVEAFASTDNYAYSMNVCCGLASNFTIPTMTVHKNLDFNVFDLDNCGLQHQSNSISPNENVTMEEFPWLALIMSAMFPKQRELLCGGSLINERYVLTSAHCSSKVSSLNKTWVSLGNYNLRHTLDCIQVSQSFFKHCSHIQEYRIENTIIHPFYDKSTTYNDISLLRLNNKVTFTDYVRPICLPRSEDDVAKYGETLLATGFGHRSKNTVGRRFKKKIPTILIPNKECKEVFTSKLNGYISPLSSYHICTKDFKNTTDKICYGDEGGPVMLSKNSKWFINGISLGQDCENESRFPYLDVYKYLKWITFNVKD